MAQGWIREKRRFNMKIYTNELRTVELDLNQCDLELGRLETKEEIIHHDAVEGVKELGHYEVIARMDW